MSQGEQEPGDTFQEETQDTGSFQHCLRSQTSAGPQDPASLRLLLWNQSTPSGCGPSFQFTSLKASLIKAATCPLHSVSCKRNSSPKLRGLYLERLRGEIVWILFFFSKPKFWSQQPCHEILALPLTSCETRTSPYNYLGFSSLTCQIGSCCPSSQDCWGVAGTVLTGLSTGPGTQ